MRRNSSTYATYPSTSPGASAWTSLAVRSSSSHCVSDEPSSNGVHWVGSHTNVR